MNLMDLAIKIGVDDQASSAVGEISQKLGNGLKAAAKVGIAAVSAASAAVVALAKESVEAYAEYEQLVGGVDTLFKSSSQKLQTYAANAYKTAGISANEYMSLATSFSASLLQSLAKGSEESSEEATAQMEEQLDAQYEALENSNDEKLEALEESHDQEIKAFKELTEQKIALIDKQYMENLKLIDEEKYNQLKAIDEQIAALEGLTEAERKEAEQREREEKKAALQRQIDTASNIRFREAAEKELSEYLAEIAREDAEAERKLQIEQLESQKTAVEEAAAIKKEALREQRDAEVDLVEESSSEQLDVLQKQHKAEVKALKAANSEKLKEMKKYISEQTKYLSGASSDLIEYTAQNYEDAAEYADLAITDMADNANKMGTSMEMIQNAYQGFAKQNYTMLDNLKLGYGGTKTEMERLIRDAAALSSTVDAQSLSFANVVEAIHVVQTEMGITGTTSKEAAETISGSVASMKAAWENLKVGISDENADIDLLIDNFVESASAAGTNILDRATVTVEGIKEIFSNPEQRGKFIQLGKDLLGQIADGMKAILGIEDDENPVTWAGTTARNLLEAFVDFITGNVGDATDAGKDLLSAFFDGFTADNDSKGRSFEFIAGEMLGKLIRPLADAGESIVDYVWALITGDDEAIEALKDSLGDFGKGFAYGADPTSGAISVGYDSDKEIVDVTPELTEQYSSTLIGAPKTPTVGSMTVNVNYANPNISADEIGSALQTGLEEWEESNE